MAIYIPLKEALELCDKAVRKNKEWRECKNIKYFNIDDLGQILCEIANKCGKFIEEDGDVMFAPQMMPESTDPKGSTRYYRYIVNEKIPSKIKYKVSFPDNPKTKQIFRVREFSSEFKEYSSEHGNGVVLDEGKGNYSWWFNDMSKGITMGDIL